YRPRSAGMAKSKRTCDSSRCVAEPAARIASELRRVLGFRERRELYFRRMEWSVKIWREGGPAPGRVRRGETTWTRRDASVSTCSVFAPVLMTSVEVAEGVVRIVKSFETSSVRLDISGISRQARHRNKIPLRSQMENSRCFAFIENS